MTDYFKECPNCHEKWKELTDFVSDPFLELMGQQPNLESPLEGHFVFNHNKGACFSTLLVQVKEFLYLSSDILAISKFISQSPNCKGFCQTPGTLESCSDSHCKAKQVKKILTIINAKNKAIIKKLDK